MAIQANPYPLRLEKELLEEAKVIAKENGRSLNKEIEFLLKIAIKEYEAKNGTINVDTL